MDDYQLNMKRVYEKPEKEDGYRILVDRIWPRGVSKDKAAINEWAKEITPTSTIRKEFDHQPQKFEWFKQAYWTELTDNPRLESFLIHVFEQLEQTPVTFVYAAKDEEFNHVVVLMDYIKTIKAT
ncbi:MAG: hypothetical protein PWR19_1510 [Carnobacterium sp.]|uniref:DUF488 domain-containing protein n=1 Tax=Carnobacterium TaxID=2747 RepID=UPI00203CD7DD|nr:MULTISPECIES: DUF488 family protein [Carnobacterium]MCM3512528.1 DUF488 family protein [Carnobacterium inhibens]MDN5372464.1 hypothetical protein [Carnobacterium sp.]